jgi:hypothetical protein
MRVVRFRRQLRFQQVDLRIFVLYSLLHESDPGVQVRRGRFAGNNSHFALLSNPLRKFINDRKAQILIESLGDVDFPRALRRVRVRGENVDSFVPSLSFMFSR